MEPSSRKRRPFLASSQTQTSMSKKSVRWSTVTVYEFGEGIGGSAVPRRGGPAVGLAKTPRCVWITSVDAAQSELAANDSTQEAQNGKAGDAHAVASTVARRHRRRVRWLKPLERVTMLEKAGYSEERIYRILMESCSIVQSRRLCLRAVSLECAAA